MPDSLTKPIPKALDLGLGSASKLAVKSGWLNADITASNDKPLTANLEAGAKLTPDWAAYGHAWWQPTDGLFGGGAALRYRDSLDLFVEGSGSQRGDYSIVGGVRVHL